LQRAVRRLKDAGAGRSVWIARKNLKFKHANLPVVRMANRGDRPANRVSVA
jgi:hypothetical protein